MNSSILSQFEALANKALDSVKAGERIDRKQLVANITSKPAFSAINESDGLNLLAVIVKHRPDFQTIKGPQGGTFKNLTKTLP